MRSFKVSIAIAIASCVVALSAGVPFADDLHNLVPNPNLNPGAASAAPGQTGSNVLSSCGPTSFFSIGAGAKSNAGERLSVRGGAITGHWNGGLWSLMAESNPASGRF